MRFKFAILLSITVTSCGFSDNELKKGWWKYGSGAHIGDFLNFERLILSNDTIYRNNVAVGVIVDREESWFGVTSRKIFVDPLIESHTYIESIYENDYGVYHQK
jgi:hypothetical protein